MKVSSLWVRVLCILLAALMVGGVVYYALAAFLL